MLQKRLDALKKVLIIDDDIMIRNILTKMFHSFDSEIKVWQSINGERALSLENDILFNLDLIITDLNMPKMSGSEFILHFREQNKSIPILIFTGSSCEFNFEEFKEKNNIDHLSLLRKPSKAIELKNKVNALLK